MTTDCVANVVRSQDQTGAFSGFSGWRSLISDLDALVRLR